MIRHRFLRALALIGASAVAAPVLAQPTLSVTPVIGATLFLSDPPSEFQINRTEGGDLLIRNGRFRDAIALGVLNGVHLNRAWEIEALFTWTPSELEAEEGLVRGYTAANQYMYGVSVNYHFPQDLTVAPYLSLGLGGETWDFGIEDANIHHDLMLQAGGGIDLPLGDYFGLRLDLRDCVSRVSGTAGSRNAHHLLVVAGITLIMPSE